MEIDTTDAHSLRDFTINLLLSVGPWVAEHLAINDEAVKVLKAAVAYHMVEVLGFSVEKAATCLGVSDRWIYTHLDLGRGLHRLPQPDRLKVLEHLAKSYPQSFSLVECQELLNVAGVSIHSEELMNSLDALASLGYLQRDGLRYRSSPGLHVLPREQNLRLKNGMALTPSALKLIERYVLGDGGAISDVKIKVKNSAYLNMLAEIRSAVAQAASRAIAQSLEADQDLDNDESDETVVVDVLLLFGASKAP